MAYSFIPKNENEIKSNNLSDEIIELYKICKFYSKTEDPLAIDLKNLKTIKITRLLTDKFKQIKKEFNSKNIIIKLGDGSRGNKGLNNLGLQFEKDLYNDLINFVEQKPNIKYKDFIQQFFYNNKLYNYSNIEIKSVGSKNNNRPLRFEDKYIYIGNEKSLNEIGKTVADILLITGTTYYNLSLKYGNTTTFFNVGCKKIFDENEIKNCNIVNKNGKLFLEIFGLEENLFCKQFNTLQGVGKKEPENLDLSKIKNVIETGIGCDYHLVHLNNNIVTSHYISDSFLNKLSNIDSYEIIYPYNAKRINISIKNKYIKMGINIRNKMGGIYPTHIMADYKLEK
jgi:hypothetical protein